jgi:hypothetical protein
MADSPLSTPGTPRTMSPLPSEADLARSFTPSQGDAHTFEMQGQLEGVWTNAPAPSAVNAPTSAEQVTAPKGKEKAAQGPLKLLDLPMDILKEIIHQVSKGTMMQHHLCAIVAVDANQQLDSSHTLMTSHRYASATPPSTGSRYPASIRGSTSYGQTRAPTTSRALAWMPSHTASRHWSWAMTAFPTRTA